MEYVVLGAIFLPEPVGRILLDWAETLTDFKRGQLKMLLLNII